MAGEQATARAARGAEHGLRGYVLVLSDQSGNSCVETSWHIAQTFATAPVLQPDGQKSPLAAASRKLRMSFRPGALDLIMTDAGKTRGRPWSLHAEYRSRQPISRCQRNPWPQARASKARDAVTAARSWRCLLHHPDGAGRPCGRGVKKCSDLVDDGATARAARGARARPPWPCFCPIGPAEDSCEKLPSVRNHDFDTPVAVATGRPYAGPSVPRLSRD